MATSDFASGDMNPIEPLIGRGAPIESAAEMMLSASRTMLATAAALAAAPDTADTRARELTAEAIETGFLRALRRESVLGGAQVKSDLSPLPVLVAGRQVSGTGYGRMGASVTGSGARSQLYGSIGGAVGYAVAGPIGAVLGGMLGGLFGGGDDHAETARQQEELRRQWLNPPEAFEIQAYLYNIAHSVYRPISTLIPSERGGSGLANTWLDLPFIGLQQREVVVNVAPGAVQITGQGEEAGERAARAFAGSLGRVLQLNSVVVPAAAMGGQI